MPKLIYPRRSIRLPIAKPRQHPGLHHLCPATPRTSVIMEQVGSPHFSQNHQASSRRRIQRVPRPRLGEIALIPRYTRPEMGRIWSEQNKFQKWLDVELAATETLAEAGIVPRAAAARLRERARVDVARINEIEARVRHDVIAFTVAVSESVGDPEAARWLHYGLTSNDVVDTAQALLVQ